MGQRSGIILRDESQNIQIINIQGVVGGLTDN